MANRQYDIEKYLRGEMTPAERHAFEKAAMNDPFLQDALEGAEELQTNDFFTDLQSIDNQLVKRVSKKNKIIPIWGWSARIAAGLVLVSLTVVLLWNVLNQPTTKELALHNTDEPTGVQQQTEPDVTFDSTSTSTQDNTTPPAQSKLTPASKPIVSDQLALAKEEIASDEEGEEIVATPEEPTHEESVVSEKPVNDTPPAMASAQPQTKEEAKETVVKMETLKKKRSVENIAERSAAEEINFVKGKVTTDDGIALPGVNVVVKGSTTGTVTDVYGNYQLPATAPDQSLVFSFIGMESKEVTMPESRQLDVQLEPDVSSLSEVVVVGYASTSDDEEPKIELAVPEGGRVAYKQYLEKNLHYPELALENNIEGRVTIQFTVDSFGKLGDFKVIKGLGFGCDEEVIRLIQQGPKWIPTKRDSEPVSDNVRVKMRFKSPKK